MWNLKQILKQVDEWLDYFSHIYRLVVVSKCVLPQYKYVIAFREYMEKNCNRIYIDCNGRMFNENHEHIIDVARSVYDDDEIMQWIHDFQNRWEPGDIAFDVIVDELVKENII